MVNKKLIFSFVVSMIFTLLFSVSVFAATTVECEDYTATNMPAGNTLADGSKSLKYENSKYSNGMGIKLNTSVVPAEDPGYYYLDYTVTVDAAGAYKMTLSSFPIFRGYYSEVDIKVNDRDPVSVSIKGDIGNNYSSGLSEIVIDYLSGFKVGENTIRFIVENTRPNDGQYIATMDFFTLEKASWGVSNMGVKDSPLNIVEYGNDIILDFQFSVSSKIVNPITVTVTDYNGNTVHTGNPAIDSTKWIVALQYDLTDYIDKYGHYTVTASQNDTTISKCTISVVKPLSERHDSEDNPYGIDSALSIIAPYNLIDEHLSAIKLSGALWMRDRLHMDAFSNSSYTYNGGYSNYVYGLAESMGINVHAMLMAPPTTSDMTYTVDSKTYTDQLTTDFKLLYDKSKAIGKFFGTKVASYEILNEPETYVEVSHNEPGDKFTAFSKAIALGLYDSGTDALLTSSGFSPAKTQVMDLSFRNNLDNYVNVLPYHNHTSYSSDLNVQTIKHGQINNFNEMLYNYGLDNRVRWLDEAGISMGDENLTLEKQQRQADYTVISHCEAFANGVDKFFTYLFDHKESPMSWFSKDFTGPNMVYSAYSAMTDILGEAKYLGKVAGLADGAEGYVFKNKDKNVLVLWADGDCTATLKVTDATVLDICGNVINTFSGDSAQVSLTAHPVYVVTSNELSAALYTAADEIEHTLNELSFNDADRIIMYQEYPQATRINAKFDGYSLPDGDTEMNLYVTNLGSKTMNGTLRAETFLGWEITPETTTVSVGAGQTQKITFTVTKTDLVEDNVKTAVVVRADFGENGKTLCVTDVVSVGEITPTSTTELTEVTASKDYWLKSATGGTSHTITKTSDGLKFKVTFPDTTADKWYYPRYYFNEIKDFTGTDGLVITYRTESDIFEAENIFAKVFLYESYGARYISTYEHYYQSGTHKWYIPWTDFTFKEGSDDDLNLSIFDIEALSIGLNSKNGYYDIPEYEILSVSTYTIDTLKFRQSRFDESTLTVDLAYVSLQSDGNEIEVDFDAVEAYIDGVLCESSYDGSTFKVKVPDNLFSGKYVLNLVSSTRDTKGFVQSFDFEYENTKALLYTDISLGMRIEGEDYASNDFTTLTLTESELTTGGSFQKSYTPKAKVSKDTYTIVYNIDVPYDGVYNLSGLVSNQTAYYSPATITISGVSQEYTTENAVREGEVISGINLAKYNFGEVTLTKGAHTLTVTARERSSTQGGFYFYIDYLTLEYKYQTIPAGKYMMNISLYNNTEDDYNPVSILAVYDDRGNMLNISSLAYTLPVNVESKENEICFEVPDEAQGGKVRLFLMDSMEKISPLYSSIEYDID